MVEPWIHIFLRDKIITFHFFAALLSFVAKFGSKIQIIVNRVIGEIAGHGNVDIVSFREILEMQLEEFSEHKLIKINKENRWEWRSHRGSDISENICVKKLL